MLRIPGTASVEHLDENVTRAAKCLQIWPVGGPLH
jgi:hypothetical protein